jgi:general secretion pathway protein M
MMTLLPFERLLARYPLGATAVYVGTVAVLSLLTWGSLAGVLDRRETIAAAAQLLQQLEGRGPGRVADAGATSGQTPAGSPFLDGQTITIAGASLLQRIGVAVTRVGGNVLSSQVDLQGTRSKDGFVSVIASCEMSQPALQQLLYDLEAGMPFLFVDQLVVQTPATSSDESSTRLRVLLAVSGQWQDVK